MSNHQSKWILFGILTLVSISTALFGLFGWRWANGTNTTQAGSGIEFTTRSIDKGIVTDVQEVQATYPFRNRSEQPITITEVRSSCG